MWLPWQPVSFWPFWPSSLQFFVLCHSLLQLSQLLVSGYMKSSISTIERRYGLSSQKSGVLAAFNEVGRIECLTRIRLHCHTVGFMPRWETLSSSSSWASLGVECTDRGSLEAELCWPALPPYWWLCHIFWVGRMNTPTASVVRENTQT